VPGYLAEFVMATEIKAGSVILQSDDYTDAYAQVQMMMSLFLANEFDQLLQEAQPAPKLPDNIKDYLGDYYFDGVGNVTVYLEEVHNYITPLMNNPTTGLAELQWLDGDLFMMGYGQLPHSCGQDWNGLLQIVQFIRTNGQVTAATVPGLIYGTVGQKVN